MKLIRYSNDEFIFEKRDHGLQWFIVKYPTEKLNFWRFTIYFQMAHVMYELNLDDDEEQHIKEMVIKENPENLVLRKELK